MDEMSREYHPAAMIFPLLDGPDFEQLKADITANGLLEPIVLHPDGRIIDGRNRHRACIETGTEPHFRTLNGNSDPLPFVVSMNLHRRHLTASQRAAIAVCAEELIEQLRAEARERQAHGETAPGKTLVEKIPQAFSGKTRDHLAALFNTNGRYIDVAAQLKEEEPELFEQVVAGDMPIMKARQVHVSHNSGNNEWYTPAAYIDAARAVMGEIDLDPASSGEANGVVGAIRYFTIEDNGLARDWYGRVFMNPPYASDLVGRFTEKLAGHFKQGDVAEAIVLVNNATETSWFRSLINVASAVVFPESRIKFWRSDGGTGAPLQGQAFIYLGNDPGAFLNEFRAFGWGALVDV